MPRAATALENYSDYDENIRKSESDWTIDLYGQKNRSYYTAQLYPPEKNWLTTRYRFIDKEDTQIVLSGLQNYGLTTVLPAAGLTYSVTILPEVKFEFEEEIDFFVKMSPKSIRNIKVQIINRIKASPNPIF
jgi:hypothetical protein